MMGCTYRCPSLPTNFWTALLSDIDDATLQSNCDLILLGDFNTDVLSPHAPQTHHLTDFCQQLHLTNLVSQPTRFPSATCLDLALLPPKLVGHSTISVLSSGGISDHQLLLVNVPFQCCTRTTPNVIYKRKYLPRTSEKLLCDTLRSRITSTSQKLTDDHSLHDLVTLWHDDVMTVYDKFCPTRRVNTNTNSKPRPQPWVTNQLRYLFHQRKHLHSKMIKHPNNPAIRQTYRAVRRQGTLLNRKLKSEYYQRELSDSMRNPRRQWQLINKLSGRSTVSSMYKCQASIPSLTTAFSSIVSISASTSTCVTTQTATISPSESSLGDFLSDDLAVADVTKHLKHLNLYKATGSDGVPAWLLKMCAESISDSLCGIFNESLLTGTPNRDCPRSV